MTTLRERFEQKFTDGGKGRGLRTQFDTNSTIATRLHLLAFFRQELLALAEKATEYHPPHLGELGGRCEGCAVVDLIRAKANELSDPNQLI